MTSAETPIRNSNATQIRKNTTLSTGKHTKEDGSFYTPANVVATMCRISGLADDIANHREGLSVCEPACGDGAILTHVVRLMLDSNWDVDDIVRSIYGCELDGDEACKCRINLSSVSAEFGYEVNPARWNIVAGDAFLVFNDSPSGKPAILERGYAYCLANPPYIRIHNLSHAPDSKWITGMCDAYYAFYDLGLDILAPGGTLCYIAPSSWFAAKAGVPMRESLHANANVSAVLDYGHIQLFDAATTYTAIVCMTKDGNNDNIRVYEPTTDSDGEYSHERLLDTVSQESCWIDGLFLPGTSRNVREILEFSDSELDENSPASNIRVRNGFATNLDSFFISPEGIDVSDGSPFIIDIVKSSKCEMKRGIYPYDESGKLIPFSDIRDQSPQIAQYYEKHRGELLARTNVPEDEWWCYGRSQGIADVSVDKIAIQTLTKDGSVKMMPAPTGTGVYGGVYVVGMTEDELRNAIDDESFFAYVKALRKYKSGGYWTLSGKEMEKYLRWWRNKEG